MFSATESGVATNLIGPQANAVIRLKDLILEECAFLRIHGSSYRQRHRPDRSGDDFAMIFFIAGLPWAKRDKWLVPLRWTVAMVLQRRGLPASVVSGGLRLEDRQSGLSVCVDFLAAPGTENWRRLGCPRSRHGPEFGTAAAPTSPCAPGVVAPPR